MNIFYEIPVLPSVNRDDNKMCYETVAPKNNLLPINLLHKKRFILDLNIFIIVNVSSRIYP